MKFVKALDSFIDYVDKECFLPTDINIDHICISKEDIFSAYHHYRHMPVRPRLEKISSMLWGSIRDEEGQKLTPSALKKIKTAIRKMFAFQNVLSLYKEFYRHTDMTHLFK